MILGVYIVGNGSSSIVLTFSKAADVLRASCAHTRDFVRLCAHAPKITLMCAARAQGAHMRMNFTLFALSSGYKFAV